MQRWHAAVSARPSSQSVSDALDDRRLRRRLRLRRPPQHLLLAGDGQRTLLVDCGASSLPALKACQLDPNRIEAVVLSHLHGDHFGGLPFLLLDGQFLSRRERPLLIAGPPGTRARLDALLEVFFPRSTGSKWRFRWDVVEVTPGVAVRRAWPLADHSRGDPSIGRAVDRAAPRRWREGVCLFGRHRMDRRAAADCARCRPLRLRMLRPMPASSPGT